jgi:hypothetical protein
MANEILEGFQVGMNASLRMQQLRSERAAQAARERAVAQEMSLMMEKRDLQIQYRADMAKAIGSAQLMASPTVPVMGPSGSMGSVQNPNPISEEDAAFRTILPVVAKYEPDKVPEVLRGIATAKYQQNFEPTAQQVTLPSGKVVEGIRTSRGQFTPVIDPTIETVTDPATGRKVSVLKTGTSSGRVIPQNVERRQFNQWALKNAPELMRETEDGTFELPPENFNEAARRSNLNPAFKKELMENMQAAGDTFEVGQKFVELLKPENVGVRGALSRLKGDTLGQVFPNMKASESSEMLSVARNFNARLVKTLRSDGNIGVKELDSILAGMPSPENMISSVQESKIKLAAQLEMAAMKSRASANTLGRPITPFFLKVDEIEQMIQSGQLTAEEAAKLWSNNAWNLIGTIRSQVQ